MCQWFTRRETTGKTHIWDKCFYFWSQQISSSTGYEALLGHARNNSRVCLADPLVIVDKDDNYDEVIDQLLSNKMTKVVVVFADR